MNEFWVISDAVADLIDHERVTTEEIHIPMMPFGARPLSDDRSCSPTCSASGVTGLNVMPQEANEASMKHTEGGHTGAPRRYNCSFTYEMLLDKKLIWT
jgi:hypothetical protein